MAYQYSVLIVDDISKHRQQFRLLIEHAYPEFHIYEAANGKDAFQICENRTIDLLFTDIRMSVMNGLDLIRAINTRSDIHKPVIIVVSAYPDFSYAREAFLNGVDDYLTKPFSKKELDLVIQKFYVRFETRKSDPDGAKRLRQAMSIYDYYAISRWLHGAGGPENSLEQFEGFDDDSGYMVIVSSKLFKGVKSGAKPENGEKNAFLAYLAAQNTSLVFDYAFEDVGRAGEYVLIARQTCLDPGKLAAHIESQIRGVCGQIPKASPFAGAVFGLSGSFPQKKGNVRDAYAQAVQAREHCFYIHNQNVCAYVPAMSVAPSIETTQAFSRMRASIKAESEAGRHDIIHGMMQILSCRQTVNPRVFCDALIQMNTLLLHTVQKDYYISDIKLQAIHDANRALDAEKINWSEALRLMCGIADCLSEVVSLQKKLYSAEEIITAALDYLDENYDKDITVENLAEKYHFSPVYFGNLFKKYNGAGIREHLSVLRIKKASHLLSVTDMRIFEIARSVGYGDVKYFHRIFKKQTSLTPELYRKKYRINAP